MTTINSSAGRQDTVPDGMLPFDLQKAVKGHPVVNRRGTPQKIKFDLMEPNPDYAVSAIDDEGLESWHSVKGVAVAMCSNLDLFLVKPKEKGAK